MYGMFVIWRTRRGRSASRRVARRARSIRPSVESVGRSVSRSVSRLSRYIARASRLSHSHPHLHPSHHHHLSRARAASVSSRLLPSPLSPRSRTEDDLIDGHEDELDEEPDETHDDEPGGGAQGDLPNSSRPVSCTSSPTHRVLGEVSHRFRDDVRHLHGRGRGEARPARARVGVCGTT